MDPVNTSRDGSQNSSMTEMKSNLNESRSSQHGQLNRTSNSSNVFDGKKIKMKLILDSCRQLKEICEQISESSPHVSVSMEKISRHFSSYGYLSHRTRSVTSEIVSGCGKLNAMAHKIQDFISNTELNVNQMESISNKLVGAIRTMEEIIRVMQKECLEIVDSYIEHSSNGNFKMPLSVQERLLLEGETSLKILKTFIELFEIITSQLEDANRFTEVSQQGPTLLSNSSGSQNETSKQICNSDTSDIDMSQFQVSSLGVQDSSTMSVKPHTPLSVSKSVIRNFHHSTPSVNASTLSLQSFQEYPSPVGHDSSNEDVSQEILPEEIDPSMSFQERELSTANVEVSFSHPPLHSLGHTGKANKINLSSREEKQNKKNRLSVSSASSATSPRSPRSMNLRKFFTIVRRRLTTFMHNSSG